MVGSGGVVETGRFLAPRLGGLSLLSGKSAEQRVRAPAMGPAVVRSISDKRLGSRCTLSRRWVPGVPLWAPLQRGRSCEEGPSWRKRLSVRRP